MAAAPPTAPAKTTRRRRAKLSTATLVVLVRHGTTPTTGQVLPGRAAGLHLADSGHAQAAAVADRLASWMPSIAAVYASPLERTRETATPIAKAVGQRVKIDRGLIECDFGEWTGAALKDLFKKPEWTTVQRYPSGFQFPGGESFAGMQTRITGAIASIVARHRGQTVVAVSHADPIKAAVASAMGTHLDLFQRIVVSPCSVTAISYDTGGPSVLAVNSTGSLSELRPS